MKKLIQPLVLTREVHPDWYYTVPQMKTLIIGSFPPRTNTPDIKRTFRHYEFYYPNKYNYFWKALKYALEEKNLSSMKDHSP